ncbi:LysR family transcriptional regulator [Streptomyces sp. NPDC002018]|uniref:LysR family transcriptional regulator n=1 Tax=Streptomyces sp. NPDC002018 TaxID=3364629 RepID=UPI0036AA5A4F
MTQDENESVRFSSAAGQDHRGPSIRRLGLFLTLAEELHFGRAAARELISQPVFSRQIHALERDLGVELINRTSRAVALTAAGQALLPDARQVVDAYARLRQTADLCARAVSGQMLLGALEAVTAVPPIPRILEQLRALHPQFEIRIRRLGFIDFTSAILKEEVDAAFVLLPLPEGIQFFPLSTGPRCGAMARSDPLARRNALTLNQLSDHSRIGFSLQVPRVWRDYWSANPRPDGSTVRYSPHAVADFESALSLIALGEGIQFPPAPGRHLYPRPGVSYIDVTDIPPYTTALAWLPANRDKPVVSALRHIARAVAPTPVRGSTTD